MSEEFELTDAEQEKLKTELAEIDIARITPTERKRYKAKLRKRRQREHERRGIPSGVEARLKAEWKQNLTAVEADPEKSAALRDRLFEFNYIREQMRAVIDRIRRGIHPEAEGDGSGRFFDVIASDVLELVAKYGLLEYLPPFMICLMSPHSTEAVRLKAVENMKADPKFFYRITYGLNLDGLYYLEYEEFFQVFFDWYLKNRDDEKYDFDWQIADEIYNSFQIPEKFLTGILARPRTVWSRLQARRTGASIETARQTNVTEAESRKQESGRQQAQPSRVMEEDHRQRVEIQKATLRLPLNFQI